MPDAARPSSRDSYVCSLARQLRSRGSSLMNGRFAPLMLAMLAFVLLPNLPYHGWLGRFTPTRALINIDYLLLGIAAPFLSPMLVIIGFILLALLDAFVFISTLYHFTPRELMLSFTYARYSPIKLNDLPFLDVMTAAVTVIVAITLAQRVAALKRWSGSLLLALLLPMLVVVDIGNGTNTYGLFTHLPFYTRIQRVAVNPVNSGLLASDPAAFLPTRHKPTMAKADSASRIALGLWRRLPVRGTDGTNIALVLVESWGQIDDRPALTRAIVAPLLTRKIAARYDVRLGSIGFRGSTTSAELRELRGLRGSYRDLFNLPRFRCLPDTFHAMGYDVTGMHGFHGDMFDRTSWWPYLGIQRHVFMDDLRRVGNVRTCGTAFPGVCDEDLIRAAADRLRSSHQFVYALTLNSHLPLGEVRNVATSLWCGKLPVPLDDERCALAEQWHHVFTALARHAMRTDVRPTQFIIVGDHSPPLLGVANRNFSARQVPYILLTPRAVMERSLRR